MPFTVEEHETLLNELNNPELDQTRRNEILTSLRGDYGSVLTSISESTTRIETLTKSREDLLEANSKLFRQAGIVTDSQKKAEQEKTFSETISLDKIEKVV